MKERLHPSFLTDFKDMYLKQSSWNLLLSIAELCYRMTSKCVAIKVLFERTPSFSIMLPLQRFPEDLFITVSSYFLLQLGNRFTLFIIPLTTLILKWFLCVLVKSQFPHSNLEGEHLPCIILAKDKQNWSRIVVLWYYSHRSRESTFNNSIGMSISHGGWRVGGGIEIDAYH